MRNKIYLACSTILLQQHSNRCNINPVKSVDISLAGVQLCKMYVVLQLVNRFFFFKWDFAFLLIHRNFMSTFMFFDMFDDTRVSVTAKI